MSPPTATGHDTPMISQSLTAPITPVQRRPEFDEGSRPLTWLSEKRCGTARKSRLSLPYQRTPLGTRPPQTNARNQANRNSSEFSWQGLLNKTWHVYKVSPMHRFSFEPSTLKIYSKFLASHLEAVLKNTVVGVEDNKDHIGNIKITTTDNKDTIELQLFQKQKHGQDDSGKIILSAIFFCPKTSTESQNLPESFTLMPLMLIKGSAKLIAPFIEWWQIQFDTCISRFTIPPLQLMWLVSMFAGCTTGQHSKPVEFVFKMPEEVQGLSTVTFSINAIDCQRIWQSIHGIDNREDICTSEQVVSFISALDEHFYHHFGVHLQALHLFTVGTAVVHISNDGRLKIYSADHAIQVLAYLAEEAMKQNLI